MSAREDYLRELELHWDYFRDAGFVVRVTYHAYDPATDAVSASGTACDAIQDGMGERKREQAAAEGGRAFAVETGWHLRRSQLAGPVTKRGHVVGPDGTTWVVQQVTDAGDDTDWVCECVRV